MGLIDKIKNAVPTASDPEPEANLSASDFEDEDVSNGSGDENGQQTGAGDDGKQEPESGDDRPREGEPSGDAGEEQSDPQSSDDGDSTNNSPAGSGEQPDTTPDQEEDVDGEGSGQQETGSDESDQDGQQSLFDYEDPDAWEDPSGSDGDENADESGSDGMEDESGDGAGDNEETGDGGSEGADNNSESTNGGNEESQKNNSESPSGEEGDDGGDASDRMEDESGNSAGDNEELGDGISDGSDNGSESTGEDDGEDQKNSSESPTGEKNSDDSGASDGSGDSGEGENPSRNDKQGSNETPSDASQNGEIEIEPDEGDPTRPGVGEEPYEPHPDLIDSERNQINSEKRELEQELQDLERELERFMNAMNNSGSNSIGEIQFNASPDGRPNPRWSEVTSGYRNVTRLLEKYLEQSRRDKWERGRIKGQLDSKRLHAVPAKRLDVMKRRDPGNKKKYSVIIVLDRSASMRGERINVAEEAIAKYALAMQDLDIEVCIMDMYRDTARVISPFNVDVESSKGDIISNKTAGSTPLSDAIEIARKRMEHANEFPILISVTDGMPNDQDRYLEELDKCHMPVMGITIDLRASFDNSGPQSGPQDEFYDIHTYVNSQDELEQKLEEMTMEIPF